MLPALRVPRVLIIYSHESAEHTGRVLDLSDRLKDDGVKVAVDLDETSPPDGWPAWMDRQIRESDFVLMVCTAAYRQRVEQPDETPEGRGAIWESRLIYDYLYHAKLVNHRFVPVLFHGASPDDVPVRMRASTHYSLYDDYEALYRRLTNQLRATRVGTGRLKRLPPAAKATHPLSTVFSSEHLSKTMSNPRYYDDILRLDRTYDRHAIINKETVVVVVGTTVVAELLDRPAAEFLRDHIDQRGAEYPFRRGIVVSDQAWFDEAPVLQGNPVISIGGPPANKLSAEFNGRPQSAPGEGKYSIPGGVARTGFYCKNSQALPQVGLWGKTAGETREAVEYYVQNEKGLGSFLKMSWK
jgi:hypothetical protein